jgi:hypothetical protein
MLHSLATMKKKENHTDHLVAETRLCETTLPDVILNDEPELHSSK